MPSKPVILSGHWSPGKLRQLPAHRNPGLELVYISRGRLRWQVEGRVEVVLPGSVFFTLPWETHGSVLEREPGCELDFVVLSLDRQYTLASRSWSMHPAFGLSSRAMSGLRAALTGRVRRCWPATRRLSVLFPQLLDELSRPDRSDDAVHALCRLLLIDVPRCMKPRREEPSRSDSAPRVQGFVERLQHECQLPWTLDMMAEACRLGRTQFARLLLDLTGDRPLMALNRARVKRAGWLLRESDLPVTRIALDCGFGSSQHFANVFRAYSGCTARQFRHEGRRRVRE
jgi:AraC-like DNA-binding protein